MDIQKELEKVQSSKVPNKCISEELHEHIISTFNKVEKNDRLGRIWHKVYCQGSDSKYGSYMISIETKEWRNTTMSEFYGGAVVD